MNLPDWMEYCVVEECLPIINSKGTYRKTQKSKLMRKLSLQSVDLQESYIALVDMEDGNSLRRRSADTRW